MSEDLRYYFFDHEADEQPPVSSEEGWKSMQQLLDKEMPVSSKRRRRFVFLFVASIAGIILLATAIPVKNYFEQTALKKNHEENIIANKSNEKGESQKEEVKESNNIAPLNKNDNSGASIKNTSQIISNNKTNYNQYNLSSKGNKTARSSEEINKELLYANAITQNLIDQSFSDQNKNAQLNDHSLAQESTQNVSSANKGETKEEKTVSLVNNSNKKQTNKNFIPGWQLSAGIGMNMSLSNTLNSLRPYPVAELKYNFSPRFFAGASIGLFSPVGSTASGVKKTVYVNDTSSNISKYNEKLNYNRLTYIDAALTAGMKISNKLSLQTGIQVSRVVSSSTSTTLEPYDFNSNIITMQTPDVTTIPVTPAAAPVYNNRIELQKIDVRYIAGINYDLKKVSFGLQYQAGINPILKGDIVTGDKNKIIMLRASYRFK
jgi:hypothetical protein